MWEVNLFEKNLKFSVLEARRAQLHTPLHRRPLNCTRQYTGTQLWHVAFYSTEAVKSQHLQYILYCETAAFYLSA